MDTNIQAILIEIADLGEAVVVELPGGQRIECKVLSLTLMELRLGIGELLLHDDDIPGGD